MARDSTRRNAQPTKETKAAPKKATRAAAKKTDPKPIVNGKETKMLELGLLCDCTSSMGSWIVRAK
jgi:hypothetical protein